MSSEIQGELKKNNHPQTQNIKIYIACSKSCIIKIALINYAPYINVQREIPWERMCWINTIKMTDMKVRGHFKGILHRFVFTNSVILHFFDFVM